MKKKSPDKQTTIVLELSTKETCEFTYSSRELAQQHYDQLKTQGTICGYWITKMEIE